MEVYALVLQVFSVLVIGLMCGSELSVAAFDHPALERQRVELHIAVRASLAQLLGRVMPFWMAGSALLNLLILLPFAGLTVSSWRLAAAALGIQIASVVFSLAAPVPINKRISGWTPSTIPEDWKAQEKRWGTYHWFRTCGLVVAFALLSLSLAVR